ncbi:MAG: hypothetical protein CMJ35_09205 [Phycisphaerae bacterium]|nr:hypothetical protein [Phycisphaerae bacterium]MBM91772.1 hypothetical protein [Phycisphaerae bacterium]
MENESNWLWFVPIEWFVGHIPSRLLGLAIACIALLIIHQFFVVLPMKAHVRSGKRASCAFMMLTTIWVVWSTPAVVYCVVSFFMTLF